MDRVRALTSLALEGSQHLARALFDLRGIDGGSLDGFCVVGGGQTGAAAEDKQIRKRIAAKPVRAMQSGCRLTRGKESGHGRPGGLCIDANTSHHVMTGWSDLHGPLGDVYIREFLELMVHAGQLFLYIVGGLLRDIEISSSVFGATALADLGVD